MFLQEGIFLTQLSSEDWSIWHIGGRGFQYPLHVRLTPACWNTSTRCLGDYRWCENTIFPDLLSAPTKGERHWVSGLAHTTGNRTLYVKFIKEDVGLLQQHLVVSCHKSKQFQKTSCVFFFILNDSQQTK